MLTKYNEEEERYEMVEEPDPSITYTYADYLKWKFKERLELIRGRIFRMGAPNPTHQQISVRLVVQLYNFLNKSACKVFPAPFDVRLPVRNKKKDNEINTIVQPDICVVYDESKIDGRGCCGTPDLVIEILSPGNSSHEVRTKFELYQDAGVPEYWLINPVEENLIVYVLNKDGKFEGGKMFATDDIVESVAINGFILEVTDIFNHSLSTKYKV